ncbi:MAG: alpha/beta fold hydrolase [Candidatus Sulfotelmatobacter sp.]
MRTSESLAPGHFGGHEVFLRRPFGAGAATRLGDSGCSEACLFGAKAGGTAWKSKPTWYIVGKKDHTVHPDLERAMAKRMGATVYELDSSHVPMLSEPERVLDVIRAAAKAVQATAAA